MANCVIPWTPAYSRAFQRSAPQPLGKAGVFSDDHGFQFVLQNGLENAGPAADHAERAVRPSGDAGVGAQPQDQPTGLFSEIVDSVGKQTAGWKAEHVGLETSDFELILKRFRGGEHRERG